VVAAIILWNSVYLERAIGRFVNKGVKSTRGGTLVGHSHDFPYQGAVLPGFDHEICYIGT
jgi:hypothetical protein